MNSEGLEPLQEMMARGWAYFDRAFREDRQYLTCAHRTFRQVEELSRRAGLPELEAEALSAQGMCLRATGQVEQVQRALEAHDRAAALWETLGREEELATERDRMQLAYRDLAVVDRGRALEYLKKGFEVGQQALTVWKRRRNKAGLAQCCSNLADLCCILAQHDPGLMRRHLAMAATLYQQAEELWGESAPDAVMTARMGLAEVYIALNANLEGAEAILKDALGYYSGKRGTQVTYQLAQANALLARCYRRQGRMKMAREHETRARSLFRSLGFEV